MQGKWLEEQIKRTLLETELKQAKEELAQERKRAKEDLAQERLLTMSIRLERDKFMKAEAEYVERARVLEGSNHENKQAIRDHAALQGNAYKEFTEQLLSQTDSLLTDKLNTFGATIKEV